MESDSNYPDWLYDAVYEDTLFAAAYAAVAPPRRAVLKTCIARLFDWYGPARISEKATSAQWRQGFSSLTRSAPRNRCAVLFDATVGPAALLAALMPARALGLANVVAVYTGESKPGPAVLVALELAGQELVLGATGKLLDEIVELHAGPNSCMLTLGETSTGCCNLPERVWTGPVRQTLAVWQDAHSSFDLAAIRFAHCEAEITVMGEGEGEDMPEGVTLSAGNFADLLGLGAQAIFAPAQFTEQALEATGLVFGPGHEGCWLYPELSTRFFLSNKVAWT
jgi:hypothetical protein